MKGESYFDPDEFMRTTLLRAEYPLDQVQKVADWKEQLNQIRSAYSQFERRVAVGAADWMEFDPYEVGDWAAIFTPIEQEVWSYIRRSGLPLWPQLPVGAFVVDFGNPIAKVAVECDGAQYHNAIRDSERDFELRKMGWATYRIPGWRCLNSPDHPCDPSDMTEENWEDYAHERDTKTPIGILKMVAQHFPPKYLDRVMRML